MDRPARLRTCFQHPDVSRADLESLATGHLNGGASGQHHEHLVDLDVELVEGPADVDGLVAEVTEVLPVGFTALVAAEVTSAGK